MFEKILVPLDGSSTAEIALPYARLLAEKLDADVELLSLIDRGEIERSIADPDALTEVVCYHTARFERYLSQIAEGFFGRRPQGWRRRGLSVQRLKIVNLDCDRRATAVPVSSAGSSAAWLRRYCAVRVIL